VISVYSAIILVTTGVVLSLICATYGILVHMRYLDRRLYKPYPKKQNTQQIPAVKP